MTTYTINHTIPDDFETWLVAQPNFVSIVQKNNAVMVTYNHATQQDEINFKAQLANHLDLDNDNAINYIDKLQSDALLFLSDFSITKSSLSTGYVNLRTDYGGRPIPCDTTGYTKIAVQIFWNKNGGAGSHSLRIVSHADTSKILYENTNLNDGQNFDTNVTIPVDFISFKGQLRIQVKSSNGTDSPIFDAIRIYLRR